MTKHFTTGIGMSVALAVLLLAACEGERQGSAAKKVAALDEAVAQLREEAAKSQRQVLEQIEKLKQGQQSMIRRIATTKTESDPLALGADAGIGIAGAPTLGSPDASIEVVEFGEFQCPFCVQNADLLENLLEEYPGEVRVAFRHYPFGRRHPYAVEAARASWAAAQQGKFWEMYEALFSSGGKLDSEVIRGHAEAIGLDMDRFDRDLESAESKAAVYKDRKTARLAGLKGTPTFYVNGKFAGGNPSTVRALIERERAGASGAQEETDAPAPGAQEKTDAGDPPA